MNFLGLDIGTTSISCSVIDEDGVRLFSKTVGNTCHIKSENLWEKLQDCGGILALCRSLIAEAENSCGSLSAIGIDGQMHGIVYVSDGGRAVSPLISWQDERGNLDCGGKTCCALAREITGENLPTGYGLMTVFCDTLRGAVPEGACKICTIGDYIAMSLCGGSEPYIHPSNAASLGLFDKKALKFNIKGIESLGIDRGLIPEVRGECIIGETPAGVPVCIAVGDNQASVLGSLGSERGVLINMGTGSQISIITDKCDDISGLELRPYIGGKYLINGSALCGGAAYKSLERFFAAVLEMFGHTPPDGMMKIMDAAAKKSGGRGITADTRLRGTRDNPKLRGGIFGISDDNFTPAAVSYAFMAGMCRELYDFYELCPKDERHQFFAASGNGVRCSAVCRRILEDTFGCTINIPMYSEEASYGAAILAMRESVNISRSDIQKMIKYI